MTKGEAIRYLVLDLGNCEDELTPLRYLRLNNSTTCLKLTKETYIGDGMKAIFKDGNNSKIDAINLIKNLPIEEKIEVMAILLGVIDAEDIWGVRELEYFIDLLKKIGDLDFKVILSRYQEMSKKKMIEKIVAINDKVVWLTVERDHEFDLSKETKEFYVFTTVYFCYYKFTKPSPFFYGEMFREVDGYPKSFDSIKEAVSFAKNELKMLI